MTYLKQKYFTIFFMSFLLGISGMIQFQSLSQREPNFIENNPIREIRIIYAGNKEMKKNIHEIQSNLKELQTDEQITNNILMKIEQANQFSGTEIIADTSSVQIIIEGNLNQKSFIELINTLWNIGAENIKINDMNISYENAGIETAGGQILLGSSPLTQPYFIDIFGNTKQLLNILESQGDILKPFQKNNILFTVSEKKN
jgi:uncharacterized protein YlxW (UPF0749 family)